MSRRPTAASDERSNAGAGDVAPATEVETWLGDLRVFRQAEWMIRFPGLLQGVTARGPELDFGGPPGEGADPAPPDRQAAWRRLQEATGIDCVARCRQVHGSTVVSVCEGGPGDGVRVVGEADALTTRSESVLLALTVADCVPVFMVDPETRMLALAHAGWRGIVAGVVRAALETVRALGTRPEALHVHLGPAICGECFEVGPEVRAALGDAATDRGPVDLRARIVEESVAAGVRRGRLTVSEGCTLCHTGSFFSYRGGDVSQRMCAFLGWSAG